MQPTETMKDPAETLAAAASAALKVAVAGGATAATGEWLMSSEVLAACGLLVGVIGLCAQVYYLRSAHRIRTDEHTMRKEEHRVRMAALMAGDTKATTPGAL